MAGIEGGIDPEASSGQSQLRRFAALAAVVVLVLFAVYWFFLRETYVTVLGNVEPQDAADVVKVLEAKKIPYRLADEGRTIEVAASEADKARIELVGSELPMRGQVGFELFNQSDMGLTEFAQKINYQRALQGELARSILLLDGIQSVRVHLGLPEQSLFRDEQVHPKASVALILKPGATLTASRVSGIQRMVAGAVPDLSPDAVAILDSSGRVVSSDETVAPEPQSTSDALIESYRQRALAAIHAVEPGRQADVIASLRYLPIARTDEQSSASTGETGKVQPDSTASTAPQPASRPAPRGEPDFAVDLRVMTREPLDSAQQASFLHAIQAAIGFDAAKGDRIEFVTGWTPGVAGQQAMPSVDRPAADPIVSKRVQPQADGDSYGWLKWWPIIAVGAALLLIAAFLNDRRRAARRRNEGLESFARQLQERLALSEGAAS